VVFADSLIKKAQRKGLIFIDPFHGDQLNPASYDLTLHPVIRVSEMPAAFGDGEPVDLAALKPNHTVEWVIDGDCGYYDLQPGEFILGSTYEYVGIGDEVVARVEGKSSLARLGMAVHVTGGFIDPGFDGQITLEIVNLFPRALRIYPGMRIAQIAFQSVQDQVERSYRELGSYQNQRGPTESRYRVRRRNVPLIKCGTCSWVGTHVDARRIYPEKFRGCPMCTMGVGV